MTPEQERAIIRAAAAGLDDEIADAFELLMRLIREGQDPRDAVAQAMATFTGEMAATLSAALSQVLSSSVGTASVLELKIGGVKLSDKLYSEGNSVSAVVRGVVRRHLDGFADARKLALELYEGYNFRPADQEPLQFNRRNPELPKYLREALVPDPKVRDELARAVAKLQTDNLKTEALKAAYKDALRAIDKVEEGAGQELLEKRLRVAFEERMRYFAKRIAETELHRAYTRREAQIITDDDDVEFVQILRNPGSSGTCFCSLVSGTNRYGLGPGVYPKDRAPAPPFHPFCKCKLKPRTDLTGKRAKDEDPDADRYFLERIGEGVAARVMGSQEKLRQVLAEGEKPLDVFNASKDPLYRVQSVAEIVNSGGP